MTFRFSAELYRWAGEGASWVFVDVPEDDSDEIEDLVPRRQGFGSVRVRVGIGAVEWETSVFPSAAKGAYVLPIKKAARQAAGIDIGDRADITLEVLLP